MKNPDPGDPQPLGPDQAQIVARVRTLMVLSGIATMLGIAVVLGVIGYRVSRTDETATSETTVTLPKGARVVQTAVAGDRIMVTPDIGGSVEIRTFDAKTLRQQGRLRFGVEP
jgi:hypothetical protein